MDHDIINVSELKRNFSIGVETVHALDNVSFGVKEKEFLTIMGTSGSGKSTLLNILGALDRPSSGHYYLDGIDVSNLSKDELAGIRNRKIGFVFQSFNLLPRTSALENVELPLMYNSQISSRLRREKAIEALETVGLSDRVNHAPNQLSGGQQQRVAIARALVNDPVMVLADEATGNLDSKTTVDILSLFQELNRKGKTIVFVTHEHDIAEYSKRTIVLKDGRIIDDYENMGRQAKISVQNHQQKEV